jgi:hypothetical protein
VNRKTLAKCKYLNREPLPKIAEELDIPVDTIRDWVFGDRHPGALQQGWKCERDALEAEVVQASLESARNDLAEVLSLSLKAMKRGLETRLTDGVSIPEVLMLARAIESLGKFSGATDSAQDAAKPPGNVLNMRAMTEALAKDLAFDPMDVVEERKRLAGRVSVE